MNKGVITTASTAEFFSKNLQQVGFSTPTKAVLTTIKETVDNSLDACEDGGILPEIWIEIEKIGPGSTKNVDVIRIKVRDNGPGIDESNVAKVFGEYLASSKFGRGRCTRGAQGIGITACTNNAENTTATGAKVITKTSKSKRAYSCVIGVDLKHNKGIIKKSEHIEPPFENGTEVEFLLEGKLQLNGDSGILNFLKGTSLVNPSLTLHYKLPGEEEVHISRVSEEKVMAPDATEPHPHTMKLGEFVSHSGLYPEKRVKEWLKNDFSRVSDSNIKALVKDGLNNSILVKRVSELTNEEKKELYTKIQAISLTPPSTKSVRKLGEENLAKSVNRLGEVDFFAVISRNPTICDFKPVQIEIAVARLKTGDNESPVQLLRFANLCPLMFDKASCVSTQAVESVNWKPYGLTQSKECLPVGPYIFAISITSPFIKFKNASKETIDASEELMEEIRLALIQVGQRLSKHIKAEAKRRELEDNTRYIEQFGPILIDTAFRITKEDNSRKKLVQAGLRKILGRDQEHVASELAVNELKIENENKGRADEQ